MTTLRTQTPRLLMVVTGLSLLLAWAYWPTIAFLYQKWCSDPQYSHGFLVPIFSAYLLNQNRDPLLNATLKPWPIVGAIVLLFAFVLRALGGGLLFYQLDAISLLVAVAGVVLCLAGGRVCRLCGPAIGFLIFAIPLPYELERNVGGPLKIAATTASTFLLQTCGFPAIAEGNLILIDDVKLGVVDACSGLKMLMTFAAFSIGAVLLSGRTNFEKLIVLLGIVPISLLTNVLRITATGITNTFTDDKATNHLLHDVYGWLMMPLGLALLGLELWILKRLVIQPNTSSEATR